MARLSVDQFIFKSWQLPVIDVRSPAEYQQGHIPGAHSIPLFENEERKQVGTTYKQIGKEEALLQGLDLVGPKMRSFVEQAQRLAPTQELLVHCWRGGMRSESFAWLLQLAGIRVHTLEGGYKAYRRRMQELFYQAENIVVLSGETGSGKTAILHALAEVGEQIIDLEKLAHHRGSAFGNIGMGPQPTTEQFHNNLFYHWYQLDPRRRVWLEDESFSIGQVKLPHALWERMKAAPVVKLTLPKALRIQRLVEEYGMLPAPALKQAILKIERRLGGLETQQALQALDKGHLAEVAGILLYYYDKGYERCMARKNNPMILEIVSDTGDTHSNAQKIIAQVTDLGHVSTATS